jgi:osmotically-inducible protein OsmY
MPEIELKENIEKLLLDNPDYNLKDLEVITEGDLVTIRGTVDAYWKKVQAERVVSEEPGLGTLVNQMAVVPSGENSDKAIAEDIVEALKVLPEIDLDEIIVKVQDGEATLTGLVPTWSVFKAAEEAVHYVAGVTNVLNRLAVKESV